MKAPRVAKLALPFLLVLPSAVFAELEIIITRGVEEALPVAVVPFAWLYSEPPPVRVDEVVSADLARSGYFKVVPAQDLPQRPDSVDAVNYADWRKLRVEHILIGEVRQNKGEYAIGFRLIDITQQRQVAGFRVFAKAEQLRWAAHQIADLVFEKITGIKGSFATYIAYITVRVERNRKLYSLQIADSDGHNPRVLRESSHPLMSPAWSPDGRKLAYVSFETRNSAIYVQHLYTGRRDTISAEPGINSAPSFSPDGTRLAMTLSREGNPDIYVMYLNSRILKRLTHHPAIDTEPAWSPDGNTLAFTSDRGGSPQIYTIQVRQGRPVRRTFEGSYNTRPVYSPDGTHLAMVHGALKAYRIALLELESGYLNVLTDTIYDESPSFAPNGGMILYATRSGSLAHLAAVSVDGGIQQQLKVQRGEVREPAWGPYQVP